MIEKRKKRRQASDLQSDDHSWRPSAEELEITRYLFRKLPSKDGRLSGMIVRTFCPNEAVEVLMESPWAKVQPTHVKSKNPKPRLFDNQAAVISYLDNLLQKQLFRRAIRVKKKPTVKRREDMKGAKSKSKKSGSEAKAKESNEDSTQPEPQPSIPSSLANCVKDSSKDSTEQGSPSESILTDSKSSNKSNSSKPMRLELSQEQVFVIDDPMTVYVWVYEPPPGLFNWLAGSVLIIAIILCCLFPIWPTQLRTGAYYLTLGASGLFGLLLAVALLRLVSYLFVWLCTLGKYAFWLFPNYFEDCGFFESFRPVYTCSLIVSKPVSKREKGRSKSAVSGTAPAVPKERKTPDSLVPAHDEMDHVVDNTDGNAVGITD